MINIGNDRITFSSDHLFFDGESVVYEKSTLDPVVGGLVDKSIYFVNKVMILKSVSQTPLKTLVQTLLI